MWILNLVFLILEANGRERQMEVGSFFCFFFFLLFGSWYLTLT
ncbi:hypothetical protein NC653_023540 [Populus alba x Populus x berolinensis]|uniref:Uncharacterized protein n=1 Tax=Populus alba x Populus x berolinensis TaxID=444605 RepID=A0AAD6QCB1_9ROSI|nr:hypothetical protein NC653_023540 [Populus alba x Populus x berolinensis]